jgi:dTDP-4-amino-4,6-dideoxygalactose transaminase
MIVPFVDFGAQYNQHKEEYDEVIQKCLTSGKLILQEELEEFEENLAEFLGMKYAVGVASGTDALTLAIEAIDKPVHSTSGYTFKATMESIEHSGNTPIITDIDEERLAEDVDVPVHIEGMFCRSDKAVLEDACQAIGAEGVGYSGTACYSFYPAKILGGIGDGGAVVTNDESVATKVKLLRHHWQTNSYEKYGYCSRLDNINAAFLNVKLKYLPEILRRREEIAEKYRVLEPYIGLPYYQEGRVWQDYVVTTPLSKQLAQHLEKEQIQTLGQGMTPPHEALATGKPLPNTKKLYNEMLRLPCNETLTDEQVDYVIDKVKEFYV